MSDELRDQITNILDEYSIHAAVSLDYIAELIVDKLAAAPSWQPIETAPKDGTKVDLWLADGVRWCDCYHDRITDTWRTSRPSGKLLSIRAKFVTHWMLLPSPSQPPIWPHD